MDGALNFTATFSHGVEWGWPIAVYLLLAGMSGGALIAAILLKHYKKQENFSPFFKAASLLAFVSIMLGMVCLIADLEKPLLFWKILINYNFTSVMSIGVAGLCVFIPLSFLMCLYAFNDEILNFLAKSLKSFSALFALIMKILIPLYPFLSRICLIFAVIICAYTGFLISVLIRFPLLNTAVLPALFIASGLSAGISGSSLVAAALFKEDPHSSDLHSLHSVEFSVLGAEILLILMLFVSLLLGSSYQQNAAVAFYSGVWANFFWLGVVLVGFIVPFVLNFAFGKKVASLKFSFYISSLAAVIGVLLLRVFILYAGQTYSI
ncbi:nitrite reductase [Campylobacter concisus]|uniref:NrfD/PsrC family molybdoenzyme membrane anchor subunit n=1 Tax=Campylobacter concisus TaxID=199 RepID=UPI000B3D61DC|nr:NrfD/PsrC family molybdoenzyme membrane anchor subunit [Campylobacter concisus]OUT15883.1 nitrite reductase [Campylobacter concisus]